jgi:hypothetical protein
MKKIYLLIAGLCCLAGEASNAQYAVGTSAINLGVGFGYSLNYFNGLTGGSVSPVFAGSYEYAALRLGPGTLGLGVGLGYQTSSWSYADGFGDQWSDKYVTTAFGLRGLYHWDAVEGAKYDVYAGIQLTYIHYGYTETATGPFVANYNYGSTALSSSFYPYLIVGARYFFTPNIGVFGEVGYDICYLKVGLTIKFGGS